MAEQQAEPPVTLYKLSPAWGLPSLSVACLQVEAYLRLGKVNFCVQDCSAPSASPTGQVPALDTSTDLVGADGVAASAAAPLAEFAAAQAIIEYLKHKVVDLDRGLTASQKAEAAAFTALVQSRLQPALLYSTWLEPAAFAAHTRPAYGAGLPFPLSQFAPRSARKGVAQHMAGTSSGGVYQGATEALDALAMRLGSGGGGGGGGGGAYAASSSGGGGGSSGGFFFGDQPSSLDALLYGCLAYLRSAPVAHPQLAARLAGHRQLSAYLDRLAGAAAFDTPAPSAADAELDWSAWSAGAADDKYSKAKSEKESELQRKGRRWLLCATAAIAAYVFLSGQYLSLEQFAGYEYEDEDEDEE